MKTTIFVMCLLVFSSHLGANVIDDNMSEKLRTYIDSNKLKIQELIETGSCKQAVNVSNNALSILSKDYKDEANISFAKSIYYGMIQKAYSNKSGMCEDNQNNKFALSYLIMQVKASDKNYDRLGDVYFFGKYGKKVDKIKALKYYMKEYSKNNLKRGDYLYYIAQILMQMDREDRAAVFLEKNFDCKKSQKLLKDIGMKAEACVVNNKEGS